MHWLNIVLVSIVFVCFPFLSFRPTPWFSVLWSQERFFGFTMETTNLYWPNSYNWLLCWHERNKCTRGTLEKYEWKGNFKQILKGKPVQWANFAFVLSPVLISDRYPIYFDCNSFIFSSLRVCGCQSRNSLWYPFIPDFGGEGPGGHQTFLEALGSEMPWDAFWAILKKPPHFCLCSALI